MSFEDFIEPEIATAVAVTGLLASPRAREIARRGAIIGVGMVLRAAGMLTSGPLPFAGERADDGLEDIVAGSEDTVRTS